jgi:hypothetical protein
VTITIENPGTQNNGMSIDQRHTQRDEIIRAAEREFVAAVGRALDSEDTATHRTCAVQWAQILEGLRATRV